MIGKYFIETLNKVELRINSVRINRAQPVLVLLTNNANANNYYTFQLLSMKSSECASYKSLMLHLNQTTFSHLIQSCQ